MTRPHRTGALSLALLLAACSTTEDAATAADTSTSAGDDAQGANDVSAGDTTGSEDATPPGDTSADDTGAEDTADTKPPCVPEDPGTLTPQVSYSATSEGGCTFRVAPGDDDQTAIQTALVAAGPGHTICLEAGTFHLQAELTVDTDDLSIVGAGRDATLLDFEGQALGANGLSARGDRFRVEGFTLKDAAGDGIRVSEASDVVFRNVRVKWTEQASQNNGAYGIYPVQCNGVLIEGCEVSGASDAGIYVGQSIHVRVVNNEVFGNVAGLEIENTSYAEVANNNVHDNTGGLLVFNLPGLPITNGRFALVHHNTVHHNNLVNFAPSGNIVGKVPSGTGMFVLASDDNEFHDNTVTENQSIGLLMVYYDNTLFGTYSDKAFDPYPERNYAYDNVFTGNGADPQGILKVLIAGGLIPSDLPPVGDTGCVDGAKEGGFEANRNCFEVAEGTGFINVDLCNNFQNPSTDVGPNTCTRPALEGQTGKCKVPEGLPAEQVPGSACGTPGTPVPLPEKTTCDVPYPRLSDYGFFLDTHGDVPAPGVLPYDVNAPLWADQAEKGRYLVLPEGAKASPTDDLWSLPVGTVLIKHFHFGARRIETRLLIHESEAKGWTGHTYLWNDDETEALRHIAGKLITRPGDTPEAPETQYLVPNATQCGSCHRKGDTIVPLGLTTRQLKRQVTRDGAEVSQLDWLVSQGALAAAPEGAALADPYAEGPVEPRARAWLEANCAHCHRDGGPAGVTGLWLTANETDDNHLGKCKPPTAAGAGAGNLLYDIVPGAPDESIVIRRMSSTKPAIKMPELPNLAIDEAGLALVRDWIQAMTPAGCPTE